MAWIESHTKLEGHYKTKDLMAKMGWDLDQTLGKLHRFWWWCVDHAPTGDLRKHNDNRIADAMGVARQDAVRLVEAMVVSCWIDREPIFRVHDWIDHFGFFLRRNRPDLYLVTKELYGDRTVTVRQPSLPTKPTIPNQPNQHIVAWFEELWEKYPSKDGKKAAQKHFEQTVKTEKDYADIGIALKNYLGSSRVKGGYVKNGSTWFNNWQDWIDYKEVKPSGSAKGSAGYVPDKYSDIS